MGEDKEIVMNDQELVVVQNMEKMAAIYAHMLNNFWEALSSEIPEEVANDMLRMFFVAVLESGE